MRSLKIFCALSFFLFLASFLPSSAEAQSIYGFWRSTTGNTFEVPNSRSFRFDLILTRPNGQRSVLPGRWVAGMMGSQFTYVSGAERCTGTFSATRPDVVRVVCGGSNRVSWWKRSASRRSRAAAYSGIWRSTSGSVFNVPFSRRAFNIIATWPNGRKDVYQAYWVPGMVGVQFRYGNPAITVTYNPNTPGRLRVVDARGRVFWWTRIR
jgi:hypothetical protein